MRRHRTRLLFAFGIALGLARVAGAQNLFVGNSSCPGCYDSSDEAHPDIRTDIDLDSPANATGTINSATFGWSLAGCSSAAKIKVFRRHGDTLVFIAERGPFDVTSTLMSVSLSPPIAVEQGDLIGIARVANCGGPRVFSYAPALVPVGFAVYSGDITTNVSLSAGRRTGPFLNVGATGTATEYIAYILPAAGSTAGDFGSFFRTGVQISNPGLPTFPATGRFVYHPAGVPGSSSDPSLSFEVAPRTTTSYDDIVDRMGQSGLGTLDVVLTIPSARPFIVARVYNDGGGRGTSGFTEKAISPGIACGLGNEVLYGGSTGFLITPPDPTRFRFNVGVRSLLEGARVTFGVRDVSSGIAVRYVTKTYDPTVFEQQSIEALFGGPIAANQVIEVSVGGGGQAIVYGASVDNSTNDASIQIVTVAFDDPHIAP
jgi:hypothetical protein